jgi:hypothetical protein
VALGQFEALDFLLRGRAREGGNAPILCRLVSVSPAVSGTLLVVLNQTPSGCCAQRARGRLYVRPVLPVWAGGA